MCPIRTSRGCLWLYVRVCQHRPSAVGVSSSSEQSSHDCGVPKAEGEHEGRGLWDVVVRAALALARQQLCRLALVSTLHQLPH